MTGSKRGPAALIAILLLLGLALAACGGGGDSTSTSADPTGAATTREPAPSKAYVGPANAACDQLLSQARQLGRNFVKTVAESKEHNLQAAETEGLIRPGVRILESVAARLRHIVAEDPDPDLAVYVGLYEPLLALAHLRLASGEDLGEARNLEVQMESIGAEQRLAARQAGLSACRVDFLHALVSSWSSR